MGHGGRSQLANGLVRHRRVLPEHLASPNAVEERRIGSWRGLRPPRIRHHICVTDTERMIRAYFDAFNRHDAEALLATLDDHVVHDINEGGQEVGKDAFRRFKAHMDRCYREEILELCVMVSSDRGAAEFLCAGTYLQTDGSLPEAKGQRYAIPAAAFFEVKDGKITRVTSYYNLQGWLKAIS